MSLINEPEILRGLQHDDLYVRSSILAYVTSANVGTLECTVATLAMIEKFGWEDAYDQISDLAELPIDLDTGRKLLGLLDGKTLEELPELLHITVTETALRWILSGPMDSSITLDNEINPDLRLGAQNESEMLDCRARVAKLDAKQCQSALDQYIKTCKHPDFNHKTKTYEVACWCERLVELNAVDNDKLHKWLALPIELDDAEWSKDSLRVWLALQMARWVGITVDGERSLEILEIDEFLLTDALCEVIELSGSADTLLRILERYPRMHSNAGTPLLSLYHRRQFPEVEQALHRLLENGGLAWYTSNDIAETLCHYATERNMKLAEKMTSEILEEGDRVELEGILYGFYKVLGIDSDYFDKWLANLQELSELSKELMTYDNRECSLIGDGALSGQGLYSPSTPPDPVDWQSLDDSEKQTIVEDSLRSIEGGIGEGFVLHCMIHIIVENQVAINDGDVPTGQVIDKLMEQGLDRHEAIHAVGSVVIKNMHSISPDQEYFDTAPLVADMWALNADEWKDSAPFLPGEPDDYFEDQLYLEDSFGLDLGSPVTQTIENKAPKIKRNDPCPCGSGKKFKKCCLKLAN